MVINLEIGVSLQWMNKEDLYMVCILYLKLIYCKLGDAFGVTASMDDAYDNMPKDKQFRWVYSNINTIVII